MEVYRSLTVGQTPYEDDFIFVENFANEYLTDKLSAFLIEEPVKVGFNLYLEAALAYGPISNCAACYQSVVMTAEGPGDPLPVRGKLRLDTSWSLAIESE